MSKFSESLKIHGEKLETPFTIRQVEIHLIFGPLSFYHRSVPMGQHSGNIVNSVLFQIGLLPFALLQMTPRQQAICRVGSC